MSSELVSPGGLPPSARTGIARRGSDTVVVGEFDGNIFAKLSRDLAELHPANVAEREETTRTRLRERGRTWRVFIVAAVVLTVALTAIAGYAPNPLAASVSLTCPGAGSLTYTVRAGDSVTRIAERQFARDLRWADPAFTKYRRAMRRLNPGVDLDQIKPGERLRVPSGCQFP